MMWQREVWIQMLHLDSGLRPWNPQDALWVDSLLLQKRQQLQREREKGERDIRSQTRLDKNLLLTSAGRLQQLLLHTGCGQSISHSKDTETVYVLGLKMWIPQKQKLILCHTRAVCIGVTSSYTLFFICKFFKKKEKSLLTSYVFWPLTVCRKRGTVVLVFVFWSFSSSVDSCTPKSGLSVKRAKVSFILSSDRTAWWVSMYTSKLSCQSTWDCV